MLISTGLLQTMLLSGRFSIFGLTLSLASIAKSCQAQGSGHSIKRWFFTPLGNNLKLWHNVQWTFCIANDIVQVQIFRESATTEQNNMSSVHSDILFDFTDPATNLDSWVESSDTVREVGMSKASFVVQQTRQWVSFIAFWTAKCFRNSLFLYCPFN